MDTKNLPISSLISSLISSPISSSTDRVQLWEKILRTLKAETVAEWKTWRRKLKSKVLELLGGMDDPRCDLQPKVLERVQMDGYVRLYEDRFKVPGDNPTIGLILCADKNDAVVRYTLGEDQQKTIFASRYKLHLPSENELRNELRREVRALSEPTLPTQASSKSARSSRRCAMNSPTRR